MIPRLELKNRLKYGGKRDKIADEKIPFYVVYSISLANEHNTRLLDKFRNSIF